jgi:hypothetical protein
MQVIFSRASPVNNFAKKWSLGPKNGLERRAWQFYTICDKNPGLKVKMTKLLTSEWLIFPAEENFLE